LARRDGMGNVARRDFLKAATAAAAAAPLVGRARGAAAPPRIGSIAYSPVPDYPILPKPYWQVRITDAFWKEKIDTNARVTIPFEVEKLTESERGQGSNVLEAAILSLKTHPNSALQAQVEARVQEIRRADARGNSGFEVAATYYM